MVGETIFYKNLQEQLRLNQKSFNQVERELDYLRNVLNNYKTGTTPSAKRLVELAKYFGIDLKDLLGTIK